MQDCDADKMKVLDASNMQGCPAGTLQDCCPTASQTEVPDSPDPVPAYDYVFEHRNWQYEEYVRNCLDTEQAFISYEEFYDDNDDWNWKTFSEDCSTVKTGAAPAEASSVLPPHAHHSVDNGFTTNDVYFSGAERGPTVILPDEREAVCSLKNIVSVLVSSSSADTQPTDDALCKWGRVMIADLPLPGESMTSQACKQMMNVNFPTILASIFSQTTRKDLPGIATVATEDPYAGVRSAQGGQTLSSTTDEGVAPRNRELPLSNKPGCNGPMAVQGSSPEETAQPFSSMVQPSHSFLPQSTSSLLQSCSSSMALTPRDMETDIEAKKQMRSCSADTLQVCSADTLQVCSADILQDISTDCLQSTMQNGFGNRLMNNTQSTSLQEVINVVRNDKVDV